MRESSCWRRRTARIFWMLPSLELMGIVRKDGKSTKLADSLGSESGYRAAVAKILKAGYPEELLAMDYSTKSDRAKIQR